MVCKQNTIESHVNTHRRIGETVAAVAKVSATGHQNCTTYIAKHLNTSLAIFKYYRNKKTFKIKLLMHLQYCSKINNQKVSF